MEKKIPMRTCVACRGEKPKRELIRVVKYQEEISLDKTGKANGRGAYICKDLECLKKLKKQNILNKVFSTNVSEQTYAEIEEALNNADK